MEARTARDEAYQGERHADEIDPDVETMTEQENGEAAVSQEDGAAARQGYEVADPTRGRR
jgi:hypothetical protein